MLPYFPRPSILVDRRRKSGVEMPPNCPRCDSSNTKFCYYNNYSLSQPRYFCKGCRRYWTKGGSLRNVPVGGGCRKNRPAKAGRMSADRAAESNYGCRRLQQAAASMRPDLLLDDPASSSCCPGGIGAVSPAGESRPGGADIDLALLYTKILNQCSEFEEFPAPEVPLEVEEPFDLAGVVDADQFVDVHLESQHRGPDLLQRPALSDMMSATQFSSGEHLPSAGDSSFYLDPSFCLPQTLPAAGFLGGDMFWSSCATAPVGLSWQQAQSPGMGTVEEEHLQPQPNPFINSWNTFSFSSCEAFPKT